MKTAAATPLPGESGGNRTGQYAAHFRPRALRVSYLIRKFAALIVTVVVAADTTRTEAWVEDASVAATMLLLQAEDMGLGACWVQVNGRTQADGTPSADIVRDILSLPAECAPLAIVAVGHKAAERKPQNDEKLLWEKIHLNGYRHEDKGVR